MAASKAQPTQAKQGSTMNILYVFTYFFSWLSGIIMYVTEGQTNKRMKFHSLQAILLGIVGTILWIIPFVGWLLGPLVWLYGLYIGVVAYGGKDVSVPVLGDYAKQWSA